MSVEFIVNKIMADAEAEISEIEKKTQSDVDALKKEFEDKENEAASAISDMAEKKIHDASSKSAMFFEMKEKADILQAKQSKATELEKRIIKSLEELADPEYKKLLKKHMGFALDVKDGSFSVPVHKKKVFESVLKDMHSNIPAKEDENVKNGFVFNSEKFSVTFSFGELAGEYLRANLNKVLSIIFK